MFLIEQSSLMSNQNTPTVLVVDDEPELADLFAAWLQDEYRVQTAYDGQTALEALDESIDVVLLDRLMPDVSGDEVLTELRNRGLDCRVAMVTAVDPDVDILAMGFDDYVTKPVSSEGLHDVVATLCVRKRHDETVRRYYQLVSKRAALETNADADVASHPEYETLLTDIETLSAELDALQGEFDDDDFLAQLHQIERGATTERRDDGGRYEVSD